MDLVLTVIGADRPGLVEALARTVLEHGANWEASRMAQMAGRFAGILRVRVPDERALALELALRGLDTLGLRVQVEAAQIEPADLADSSTGQLLALEVLGQDRPGIVQAVAVALAQRGVNVEELETACESAAMSGEMLFRARALLRVSAATQVADLRLALDRVASDLMVDAALHPPGDPPGRQR
jgi:glycine cleavage system regulatory protein